MLQKFALRKLNSRIIKFMEKLHSCETYSHKFAPTLAKLFISTLSILPKCSFSKKRVQKFNSSVLVSNFTVLMNLPCGLPV